MVAAEWDFEGLGTFPHPARIDDPQPVVRLSETHAYGQPGTYFAVIRATSQRDGDARTPYGRVQNLGRARVVVT